MITEGEFDALIVKQVAHDLVSVASTGSAANKHINPRWFPKLISAPSILLRMDTDHAGRGAVDQIGDLSQAVKCVQVPEGKDLNDFYLTARNGIIQWFEKFGYL